MSLYKLPPEIHNQLDEFTDKYERIFDKRVTRREKVAVIATEGFQIGLVTYLILLLLETIKEGFVSYFFNMNYLLAFVLLSGVIMVLATKEGELPNETEPSKLTFWKWTYIFLMSIGGGGLVFYKTAELGNISIIISGITIIIIFLLSILIYIDDESTTD